jgi:hypothetical protein
MAILSGQFQVGQKVSLKDTETGYRLVGIAAEEPGLEVVAIHADYIVLDDTAAGVRTRVPTYLINTAPAPPPPAPPVTPPPVAPPPVAPPPMAQSA